MFILQEFFGEKFSLLREFFRIQGNIYLVLSYHVLIQYFAKSLDTFDNIYVILKMIDKNNLIFTQHEQSRLTVDFKVGK